MTSFADSTTTLALSDAELRRASGTTTSGLDAEAIEGVRRGDPHALGEVYALHHEAVRAFARRLIGDDSTAADLVHDTFVALPRALRSFRGDSSLRTFLMAIAVRYARRHVRAAARRRAAFAKLSVESRAIVGDLDGDAGRRELARIVLSALDRVPTKQRVVFVLCDVEGCTAHEAAAIVGAPEATVRTRLLHARRKLRVLLAKRGIQ